MQILLRSLPTHKNPCVALSRVPRQQTSAGLAGWWHFHQTEAFVLSFWGHNVWFCVIPSKIPALHSLCPGCSVLPCQAACKPKSGTWCGWNKNSVVCGFFSPWISFQMDKFLNQFQNTDAQMLIPAWGKGPHRDKGTGQLLSLTARSVGWALASSPPLQKGDDRDNSLFPYFFC